MWLHGALLASAFLLCLFFREMSSLSLSSGRDLGRIRISAGRVCSPLPDRFTAVRLARASTLGGTGGDIMGAKRKQAAKASAGLLGDLSHLPPSVLDSYELGVLSSKALTSERSSADVVQFLLKYLRDRGQELPVLAMMAEWLDPNAGEAEWQFILRRRKRGRRRSHMQFLIDLNLEVEVDLRAAELHAEGLRSPRKRALGEVAARHGLSDKGLQAAMARAKKRAKQAAMARAKET